jgi:predicted Rossmann fold flavoprotein
MMAAIQAARLGRRVVLCEGRSRLGLKLLASGGGRCNVTNTLPVSEIMERFGPQGRFMAPALARLGPDQLREFLRDLGVETHAPDGLHVFPVTHQATTVHAALLREMDRLGVDVRPSLPVPSLDMVDDAIAGVRTADGYLSASAVLLATGGRGYPALGGGDSGYDLARQAGHRITALHPAMVPLRTEGTWPANCRADTVPKASLIVRGKGRRGISGTGDLIFTKTGLAGPLVLDVARDITPLLDRQGTVPAMLRLTHASEQEWNDRLSALPPGATLAQSLENWLPATLADAFCGIAGLPTTQPTPLASRIAHRLAALLAQTPITLCGSEGWDHAMVTRGGVALNQVEPETLESRHVRGLHFAGEMLDLDGPCGGFNLQWAFASGSLAATSFP